MIWVMALLKRAGKRARRKRDRDNLAKPGEAVTASEVGRGNDSKEEREKGIGVEGWDMEGMGREEGRDGGKERSRDRGEGWAVENDVESIPEGVGGGGKRGTASGSKAGSGEVGRDGACFSRLEQFGVI